MKVYKFTKLKLIFIFNPKCACTTIKHIINQIDNIYEIKKYHDIHKYSFSNTDIESVMTKYKDYHVIYFIRNPYNRFISGYSKFTNKLILKIRFDITKNLEECNKIINYGNINMKQWMKIIENIRPENLDFHFKPQTSSIENLLEHKNIKLYDIEDLINLEKYINNLFKIKININIHPAYNRNYESIDSDTVNSIYKYYYDDFHLLGYTKDSYSN